MRILTLSQLSLAGSSGIAEAKIPLWWADGTTASTTQTSAGYTVQDGSATFVSGSGAGAWRLFTLSSNWPVTTQFALEVTLASNGAGYTANAGLMDDTPNTLISGSQVSTQSSTQTVLRSGKFTLTPSHYYKVTAWLSTSGTAYICDASLIIFPS